MKWSILIPTTLDREDQYNRLYKKLLNQIYYINDVHPDLGEVEVLSDGSKRFLDGGMSIGEKRQKLLDRARGEYVSFMDDDDDVAPNYIEIIMRAIYQHVVNMQDADIITFNCIVKNDFYWALIKMQLSNKINEELTPEKIVKRRPWHICPVKTPIAKKEKFTHINHNEDWDWMGRVLNHVNSEIHIPYILTQYNHSEKNSEADKIIREGHE